MTDSSKKIKHTKVYTYTRVSTSMQVDGFSLDAQKERIRKYAAAFDYKIVGEYEDAGKSGKSIEGRSEFRKMLEDIQSNKDGVSFVLVFKLSRFGRNAADILSSLQIMQENDVNLISVEDGIDSSKGAGKLIITVLSAVAEVERENILIQTMEGRKQKAREGKWNGGFAPYGYKLENGELVIVEKEAEAIRLIFDKYVNSSLGANGVASYLQKQGIEKIIRQNGKTPFFTTKLIRSILDNPVYVGKIAYGRRKVSNAGKGKPIKQANYLLCDGIHEAIIDEDIWEKTHKKREQQAAKYEHVNKGKDQRVHLLSGLLRCPICGAGLYSNKSTKSKDKDNKQYYYYACKHRKLQDGYTCTFKRQLNEEKLDNAVAEIISKLVSNPKFAKLMQEKIDIKTDTSEIDKELNALKKQLTKHIGTKRNLENQIDSLDIDDRHYERKSTDLQERLDKIYDSIYDVEQLIDDVKSRKNTIETAKLTTDNIYKTLINFDRLYNVMEDEDKKMLLTALIKEIQVHEEPKDKQWLKSIVFKLPLIDEEIDIGLDNERHVECVVLMTRNDR